MFQHLLRQLTKALDGPSTQETTSTASVHHPATPVPFPTAPFADNIHPPPPPYEPSAQEWQLVFHLLSEPEKLPTCPETTFDDRDWTALLTLRTRDLPGLMKKGLYLSQGRVQAQDNHLERAIRPDDKKPLYTRVYALVDATWTGQLRVAGWSVKPLSEFRVTHISADQVVEAIAFDQNKNMVYNWNALVPENNFNMIYDDMHLKGLWPWPREGRVQTDGKDEKTPM